MKTFFGKLGFVASIALGSLSVAGCGGGSSGELLEQLEAIEVKTNAGPNDAIAGIAKISGNDRDFKLTIEAITGSIEVDVHSPGASPLASLADRDIDVRIIDGEGTSLLVLEAASPVYYANNGVHSGVADELFGKGFARWGASTGQESDGTFIVKHAPAVFATDDGDVELRPGSARTITVKGAKWRVAVVASYEVEADPTADEQPGCDTPSVLSYERLRIEAEAEPSTLKRSEGAEFARYGCLAGGD
jgi:hypothetical protein